MKCFNSLLISFWVYPILIFFVFILGIAHSIIRLSLLNWIYTSQTLIAYDSAPLTSLVAQTVKHLPTMWEAWVWSLGWEDPLEKEMAAHSSILAWKSHGQWSLVGYSQWGHKELDMTKQLSFYFTSFQIIINNKPKLHQY